MEIPFLLQVYRPNFVRPPYVAGFRLPSEVHPRESHDRCPPSLFTKEHLRSRHLGVFSPIRAKASICGVALTLYRWKLKIQPLRDLALKDIESKLSEDNIVEEFFSRVIAK